MLTLFILSEQKCTVRSALVYNECSKTSWPVSSKAECLLPGRLGCCYLPLQAVLLLGSMGPSSSPFCLCLLGYQSRACLKEKEPQCHGLALTCCVPWVVQGCSPELQARLAPLRVCDLHQYLLFRLFPHPPWPPCSMDRTCFWSCTAFKMLSLTYHSLIGIL